MSYRSGLYRREVLSTRWARATRFKTAMGVPGPRKLKKTRMNTGDVLHQKTPHNGQKEGEGILIEGD